MTWENNILVAASDFMKRHKATIAAVTRKDYAIFEIGCFHMLVELHEKNGYTINLMQTKNGYKYLTSPNGNPNNFSYVFASKEADHIEIRQQVRVVSSLCPHIYCTPDIVIINGNSSILHKKDPSYALGKRTFYYVLDKDVASIHECKSYVIFPELLVSFIGMAYICTGKAVDESWPEFINKAGAHCRTKSSLYAGGTSVNHILKMITSLEQLFDVNIHSGLHKSFAKLKHT